MTSFLTGFPGFLGAALAERLLARGESVICLVQPRYRDEAAARAREITAAAGVDREVLDLTTGDITEPDLGLDDPAAHRERADEVYHLAAIYDLGVDRESAEAVNVRGTERVIEFARQAGVDRFQYVSTCYVSGRHDGVFGPSDLDVGQSFNNHYEATKFEAEVAVQEQMAEGFPATIYRPAITVGDSDTGATEKYDGLYYLLSLVDRQPGVAAVPVQPPASRYEFNVVPRDYVVDAIATLSNRSDTVREVYQLCDPNPPTIKRIAALSGQALDRRVVRAPIHARTAKRVLAGVPGLAAALSVEPAALDYLAHPTRYVSPNTRQALAGTDISPPPLARYIDRLVEYMRTNPDVDRSAMA
jgi:thioester reductase-like protein